jgi:glycerol kinase
LVAREQLILAIDQGTTNTKALLQFQADILGCPVIRSAAADLSAMGAAWLAGLATGYWESTEELEKLPRERATFRPEMASARRDELVRG